jgi:type II secretory pathway pseudopilin PulG
MKKKGGFSTVEVVITTVILAILAAIATPKLANMTGQADRAAEKKAIKSIENLHAAAILANSKSGASPYPTLGSSVGFRPEIPGVTPEPAPAEAEVLFNYGFTLIDYVRDPVSNIIHPITLGGPLKSCSALASENLASLMFIPAPYGVPNFLGSVDINLEPIGENLGVPRSEPPACRISAWSFRKFYTTPMGEYVNLVNATQTANNAFYASGPLVSRVGVARGATAPGNTGGHLHVIAPNTVQLTCEPYSERHGVEYRLTNNPFGTISGRQDLSQVRTFDTGSAFDQTLTSISPDPEVTAYYEQRIHQSYLTHWFAPNAKCERVGPAPELPPAVPADPGSPGKYPLAADGSGWCVGPGRKLPAFSDENGTPTSSHSDVVREIAADAVDDEANCPID